MISSKPYLLRAYYKWILDSNCTPLIAIDNVSSFHDLPQDYVENGEIVFNISPQAVRGFKITQYAVEFDSLFLGKVHNISVPIESILGLYAEETGKGISFGLVEKQSFLFSEGYSFKALKGDK